MFAVLIISPSPAGSNPADYVIAVGGGFLPAHSGVTVSGGELAAYYSSSHLCRVFLDNIETMVAMDAAAAEVESKGNERHSSVASKTETKCELRMTLDLLLRE